MNYFALLDFSNGGAFKTRFSISFTVHKYERLAKTIMQVSGWCDVIKDNSQ